jgi:hypothetical protein
VPLDVHVLAHQGGWDEILFVLAPLIVFAGLLALARKRADKLGPPPGGEPAADPEHEGTGPA